MSFTGDVSRFTTKTKLSADVKVRYICLHLLRDVVLGTPVDTGRARGNWQATIDQPAEGVTTVDDKGGQLTVGSADGAISRATGRVFYITNNLPYIMPLEYEGHSKQAPRGWVRTAVMRARHLASKL
jgi:hypothetical protein